MTSLFLVIANDVPVIMCEEHAKVFEKAMMINELPHTIYEMDDDQTDAHFCHVCNLNEVLKQRDQPKIILPGDLQ
jgi:hypothetical protein